MRKLTGSPVQIILTPDGGSEADQVLKKIQKLVESKKYEYKDFAILIRANDHSQPFTKVFDYAHVPYQFLGPGQLFHQEEIKDLIAYLKVLYNFDDSSALYRVLTMSIFKIPGRDIASLLNYVKKNNTSLFSAMEHASEIELSEEGKKIIEKISTMIHAHLDLVAKETAGKILYLFLEESGLLQKYLHVQTDADAKQAQNTAKFFERLKGFETQREDASIFAVVDWIDLSMQLGESPLAAKSDWTNNNAINILTVHSSKGLEFPVVFIVNLVTQRFPSRERKEQIPIPQVLIKEILPEGDFHLQEERRLFYVGMTRARDILFLTAAQNYSEAKRERKLSPFLEEALGKEIVEKAKQEMKSEETQLSLLDIFPKEENSKSSIGNSKTPITYISYSQIQTFNICPLHYKLRYILKIPTPQSPAQKFGTALHATLKDFYMQALEGAPAKIQDVEEILKRYWTIDGFSGKDHEQFAYKRAVEILKNYLQKSFDAKHLPIALETPFQFSLTPTLKVGGRIDRIDRLDGKRIEIIDYKTGSNILKEKDVERNLQLTLYGLAATQIRDPKLHRNAKEIVLSLDYIELGKKISTTRTQEQLEVAKQDIITKVQEIEASDFQCSGSIFCQNCEYKILCKTTN